MKQEGGTPLLEKIRRREAVVGVVGLGYVGLPLAVLQARTGYRVVGIDEVSGKVERVNRGENYISDVDDAELRQVVGSGRLKATTDFDALRQCDVVLLCVPTPLTPNKEPDISAILKVTGELAARAHPGMLVVLESTTYPGTTEDVLLPALTAGGLKAGQDLFLAFSPERVDPGNRSFKTHNTFKLVGGVTPACLRVAQMFYEQSIVKIHPVSSPRVAETSTCSRIGAGASTRLRVAAPSPVKVTRAFIENDSLIFSEVTDSCRFACTSYSISPETITRSAVRSWMS